MEFLFDLAFLGLSINLPSLIHIHTKIVAFLMGFSCEIDFWHVLQPFLPMFQGIDEVPTKREEAWKSLTFCFHTHWTQGNIVTYL